MVQTFPYPVAIGYSAISSSVAGFIEFNPLFIPEVGASVPLQTPSTQQPRRESVRAKKTVSEACGTKSNTGCHPASRPDESGRECTPFQWQNDYTA